MMKILEFKSSEIEDETGVARALESVQAAAQDRPIVLVEGIGKSTDRFLKAGEKSAAQDLVLASTFAEGMRTLHMQIAQQLTSKRIWKETQNLLSELFEEFSNLLQGLYLIGELSPQGRKVLSSYAERGCALIFAQALREKGLQAQPLCGRQLYLAENAQLPRRLQEKMVADFRKEISALPESGTIPVVPSSLRSLAIQA